MDGNDKRSSQPASANAWFLTLNNPQDHGYRIDYGSATEADYQRVLNDINDDFFGKRRELADSGALSVLESGLTERTPHAHSLFCGRSAIKFETLKRKYPAAHIEAVRGSVADVTDYIYKRGAHADKAETQLCSPLSRGDFFCDNREAGPSGGVFGLIDGMLAAGLKPAEICAQSPKLAFYRNAIEACWNGRMAAEIPAFRDVRVEYLLGPSGSGKSHHYVDLVEAGEGVYFVAGDYAHPFDQYAMEPVLFLDEVRQGDLTTSELLSITDGYPMTCPRRRYTQCRAAWARVYIASVIPPEDLCPWSTRDPFEQLRRRLDEVTYCFVDPSCTGEGRYRSVSVPGSDYRGMRQLEALAERAMGGDES